MYDLSRRWPVAYHGYGLQYREDVQDTAAFGAGHDLANNKEMSEDYLRDGMLSCI